MHTPDIIVNDEVIKAAGNTLKKMGEVLNEAIYSYCNILSEVTNSAIKNGKTADAIRALHAQACMLKGQFNALGDSANYVAASFLQDIDTADSYLY